MFNICRLKNNNNKKSFSISLFKWVYEKVQISWTRLNVNSITWGWMLLLFDLSAEGFIYLKHTHRETSNGQISSLQPNQPDRDVNNDWESHWSPRWLLGTDVIAFHRHSRQARASCFHLGSTPLSIEIILYVSTRHTSIHCSSIKHRTYGSMKPTTWHINL